MYIFEMAVNEDDHFMCQICPLSEQGGDWLGRGRLRLTLHVLRHKMADRKTPFWAILQNIWWYRS